MTEEELENMERRIKNGVHLTDEERENMTVEELEKFVEISKKYLEKSKNKIDYYSEFVLVAGCVFFTFIFYWAFFGLSMFEFDYVFLIPISVVFWICLRYHFYIKGKAIEDEYTTYTKSQLIEIREFKKNLDNFDDNDFYEKRAKKRAWDQLVKENYPELSTWELIQLVKTKDDKYMNIYDRQNPNAEHQRIMAALEKDSAERNRIMAALEKDSAERNKELEKIYQELGYRFCNKCREKVNLYATKCPHCTVNISR